MPTTILVRSLGARVHPHFAVGSAPITLTSRWMAGTVDAPILSNYAHTMHGAKLAAVRRVLGQPSLAYDGALLYQGDALQLLDRFPNDHVELALTSPPYNIGKQYETKRDLHEYLDWCQDWIRLVHAAVSSTGAFWLNVGYLAIPGRAKAIPIPYLLWDRVDFFLVQEIVWNYGAGVASRKSFSPRNEKFLWYIKDERNYTFNLDSVRDPNVKYPNQKKNGRLKCNPLGKNPSDVWQFPKVTSGRNRSSTERTLHPAQFPLAVVERIIKACSNPGDIILDPFMGSGTTAEAAIRTGRSVIGFEIRSDYIDISRKRIEDTLQSIQDERAQARLF